MKVLTQAQVCKWRQDGFLSPFALLDAEELQLCRDGLQRFEDWLGGPVNGVAEMKWRTMPYLVLPWAAKLAQDPRILDAVEDLLGPDLLIYTSTFFIKEPRSPTIAAWHQDFDLLRLGAERGGHGLDCANRRKPGRRLHGSPVVQGRAAAAAPRRARG